jgi:hypothetical protein
VPQTKLAQGIFIFLCAHGAYYGDNFDDVSSEARFLLHATAACSTSINHITMGPFFA